MRQADAGYGLDVAWIHDAGFSSYSINTAPGILKLLRESAAGDGLVVDLGCGSGILARQLSYANHKVLGIDASPHMIRLARANAPGSSFLCTSLLKAELPSCVAVLCIGEVLSFAMADDNSGKALDRLFRRVRKALVPGGIFVVDWGQTGRHPAGMPRKGFWKGDDWAILLEAEQPADSILVRHLTSFREAKKGVYRRTEETHRLRLFSDEDIQTRLVASGFEPVRIIRSIGNLRFTSGHSGAVATRPTSRRRALS